ncbi:MAG: Lrp/AsnC family transcriptional regulator [Candidatus Bathyarchaeia archaeon]|nr:Lrp/AsnC family transcriptional regulator [Candidatus Bathyarchaeota archaeon]
MKPKIDDLDRKILREYLEDARLSCREVAKRLNISTATVLSRLRRLEGEGVIKGYSAVLDHEKLDYTITAVTEIVFSGGRLLDVEREIAKYSNILAVYDVTGETDAIVISRFKSMSELSAFTKRLLAIPSVERTNTHIVLTRIKEDFRIAP